METRICRRSGKSFTVSEQEKNLYQKFGFPLPDLCLTERLRATSVYYNTFNLYWTKEARTGKRILTHFDPQHFPVIYDATYWLSSDFDPRDYGRDFDFNRPFFEQWQALFKDVPKPNLTNLRNEDCDYCNYSVACKHCYLTFNSLESENILYSSLAFSCKDSVELFSCTNCELCFHCVKSENCYQVRFADFSLRCMDSSFLSNCEDCSNCYQCANLKNKRYCIQNKQYTAEEYQRIVSAIDLKSYAVLQGEIDKWQAFLQDKPMRAQRIISCEDSDGTMLKNCRNSHRCFDLIDGDNNVNSSGRLLTDSADAYGWEGSSRLLCSGGVLSSQDIYFSTTAENCFNISYSMYMFQSHDCFGCYGLKKREYCILNKQYSKAEYEALRLRIIEHMKETGEWGQWWPLSMSPYYYDDDAILFLPLELTGIESEEQAKKLGIRRRPVSVVKDEGKTVESIPDHVDQSDAKLLAETFLCQKTGRAFKITAAELAFHRKLGVALPRLAWRTRLEDNAKFVFVLPHEATCASCSEPMYSLIHPRLISRPLWCDVCYLKKFGQ